MNNKSLLEFMSVLEKLKCNVRHSWTSSNRQESVAEHSWSLAVFSWLIRDDFPSIDMNKVMLMCLFHDLGEAITGDIPAFDKTDEHEDIEEVAVNKILDSLSDSDKEELHMIFAEMKALETKESKLFKALDKLEAVIQHNEASLTTWIPLEHELNLTYGNKEVLEFKELVLLRNEVKEVSLQKIAGDS